MTSGNETRRAVARGEALRNGGERPAQPPTRCRPLTVELENGQLRYVAFDGVEVLRGIAFLVRDENWGTYTPQIENLDIQGDEPEASPSPIAPSARTPGRGLPMRRASPDRATASLVFDRRRDAGDRLRDQPGGLRRPASGRASPERSSR